MQLNQLEERKRVLTSMAIAMAQYNGELKSDKTGIMTVFDDQEYFSLSRLINDSYFSSPSQIITESVKYKQKAEYEPKLLL